MFKQWQVIIQSGLKSEDFSLESIHQNIHAIFARSLAIRHVDAGSCNGCELELHAINNPYYNIEGYGVHFVSSPRHADLLLVTGPVTTAMELPLRKTYEAMGEPKWVLAVGDCACCGGIMGKNYASLGSVSEVLPVNATVVGCPPTPEMILTTILKMVQQK